MKSNKFSYIRNEIMIQAKHKNNVVSPIIIKLLFWRFLCAGSCFTLFFFASIESVSKCNRNTRQRHKPILLHLPSIVLKKRFFFWAFFAFTCYIFFWRLLRDDQVDSPRSIRGLCHMLSRHDEETDENFSMSEDALGQRLEIERSSNLALCRHHVDHRRQQTAPFEEFN